MKKFIGTALVLCCLALPLAGCEDAISTVTSTTMSELEDIPSQMLAWVSSESWLVFDSSILHCFRIYFERCTVL